MYAPKPGTKQDPIRRWNLSDRAFFAQGACHILAFAFLERFPERKFFPVWIKPGVGYRGNHVFVTDGTVAFDYRGYLCKQKLIEHYWRQYCGKYLGWNAELVRVEGNLCKPEEMAPLGMNVRGPDQYLHDALPRARAYVRNYDKHHASYVASGNRR